MHEADTPETTLARKYDVVTFDEYKTLGYSSVKDYDPIKWLAFTLIYYIHCFGQKPRAFILNHTFILKLYRHLGNKMIEEFEGVPITHDEQQPFNITSLG